MNRKVRDRIHDEMEKTGRQDKEYVVNLIKSLDEKLDVSKLVEQSYKSKADRLIASFKDKNGIRDCFAIKNNENKTIYINIAKPELLTKTELQKVQQQQLKQKKKKEEVLKKVYVSQKVIEGQIKIEDYNTILKQELAKDNI